ncbi:hypothetical protein BK055_04000 [Bacillus velezensis]|nr:hypothetical protein BK055_04000 [Bacillus velezensis]
MSRLYLKSMKKTRYGTEKNGANSFIGGFDETSSQFFSLMRNRNLQDALRTGVGEQFKQSQMPALLHGWIIKNKR